MLIDGYMLPGFTITIGSFIVFNLSNIRFTIQEYSFIHGISQKISLKQIWILDGTFI